MLMASWFWRGKLNEDGENEAAEVLEKPELVTPEMVAAEGTLVWVVPELSRMV